MAQNKIKRVMYRRKREGKTNYKKRLQYLVSNKYRVIIRASNNNIIMQLVEYQNNGDHILVSASSRELIKHGWKANKGNLPAAYLTGKLFAKKAIEHNYKEGILDLGLQTSVKGSRLYTALKGAVDGGLNIPHDAEMFPDDERIKGSHINDNVVKSFDEVNSKM